MKKVIVNDAIQKGYVYTIKEPRGKNFHAEFTPMLTPKQMLALGVFGGKYLCDCTKEFPKDWFAHAQCAEGAPDASLNFFKVHASQQLSVWQARGWIHKDDPRGWFQWYCRYYMGRRHQDDERQIKRWKSFARHAGQIRMHCRPGDITCRPVQRQALLHWAYDSRAM